MSSGLPLKADIAQYSRHVSNVPVSEMAHHWLPKDLSQSDQPDSRSWALDSRHRIVFAVDDGGGLQHIALGNPTKGVCSHTENKCSTSRSNPFEPLPPRCLQMLLLRAFAFRRNVSPEFRRTAPPWTEHFPPWCTLHQQWYSLGH